MLGLGVALPDSALRQLMQECLVSCVRLEANRRFICFRRSVRATDAVTGATLPPYAASPL